LNWIAGILGTVTLSLAASPFAGTWEGKINDLPGIELRIDETRGKVSGHVIFFFQRRAEDGKWHVEGDRTPLPMLSLKQTGKSLSFEVKHHKTHGGPEYGTNATFIIELTGADEARIRKPGDESVGAVKLTRRK
jgi:hypothetical protein